MNDQHIHIHIDNKNNQLDSIEDKIILLTTKTNIIMGLIEDVQAQVVSLQASIDAKQAAIAAAIAALEATIAAGSVATPEQLQGVLDGLKAAQADVEGTPTA